MGNYQELVFYQKARQVAKLIDTLIKLWPKTMQAQEIRVRCFAQPLPSAQILPKDTDVIKAQNTCIISSSLGHPRMKLSIGCTQRKTVGWETMVKWMKS